MNCNRISELLPWLANGTLPEPEKSLVGEHLVDCPNCRQSFDETKIMLAASQTHLPIEVLLDYAAEHKLKNFDPILFEKHLAVCGECSKQLELASESFETIESAKIISFPQAKEKRKIAVFAFPFWKYATLAACLLLTLTLGYLIYNLQLMNDLRSQQLAQTERINTLETETKQKSDDLSQTQNESQQEIERLKNQISETENTLAEKERELASKPPTVPPSAVAPPNKTETKNPQPQAGIVLLDVFPFSISRSETDNQNRLAIPRNAQSVALILNSQSASNFSRYAVELVESNGRVVWRNNNLRRYSTSDFTVNFPTPMLRPGNYTINIFGFDKNQKTKIETYRIIFTKN